jgi:hypothetical protein
LFSFIKKKKKKNTLLLFVPLLTNFMNAFTLFNICAKSINKVLKIFLNNRNLFRNFLCWKRPYSNKKKIQFWGVCHLWLRSTKVKMLYLVQKLLPETTAFCLETFTLHFLSLLSCSCLSCAMLLSLRLQILCFNVLTVYDFLQSPPQKRQIYSTCVRRTDVTQVSAYNVFSYNLFCPVKVHFKLKALDIFIALLPHLEKF